MGKEQCAVRDYCKQATIANDGVLVVGEKADSSSGGVVRERIVVPQSQINNFLYQMHTAEAS